MYIFMVNAILIFEWLIFRIIYFTTMYKIKISIQYLAYVNSMDVGMVAQSV
jgi:hypothetical protein